MAHTKKKTQWIIFLWLSSQSFPKNFPSSSKVELESLVDWHWQPTNGQKNLVQKIIVKCCNDNNKRGTNNNGLMIAKKKSLFNFTFFFKAQASLEVQITVILQLFCTSFNMIFIVFFRVILFKNQQKSHIWIFKPKMDKIHALLAFLKPL